MASVLLQTLAILVYFVLNWLFRELNIADFIVLMPSLRHVTIYFILDDMKNLPLHA